MVVLVVANLYLQAVAGQARIEAARAQLNTAQALHQRAVDMKAAGTAPGIDVLRAQVELQAQQQRLIFFQNEFEKQKLSLARAIGLPLGYYGMRLVVDADFSLVANVAASTTYEISRLAMVIGHLGLLLVVIRSGWLRALQRGMAAVGQMKLHAVQFN